MTTVELVYDLDCPNVAETRLRLMKAFAQSGASARWTEWDRSSADSPTHARRYGSPTILVNGRDVVGEPPRKDSTCCRLYRGENGVMQGVPAVGVIVAALKSNGVAPPVVTGSNGSSGWKSSLATVPGIALAFLPKLACPACWPAYAGLLSSLGLGFLVQTRFLFPLTVMFLVLAVGALAFRARTRRGYGPFVMGLVSAATVLVGKFVFDSDAAMYGGIAVLVTASVWNAWPVRAKNTRCPACVSDSSSVIPLQKEMSS